MISRERSGTRRRRIAAALIAGITASVVAGGPSPATAAITIGSGLNASPDAGGYSCTGLTVDCTLAQDTLPASSTAPGGLVAPIDGVVVRWRIKVNSSVTPVRLRITRPGSSQTRAGAGTGPSETPAPNATSTFAAQLPIRAGDGIAVDCCNGSGLGAVVAVAGPVIHTWYPRLADGQTTTANFPNQPYEILINADIEPDSDCDGLGDETQDTSLDPGGCAGPQPEPTPKADGTLTIDANKGKVEKGRKVLLSGQLDVPTNEGCEPGRAIQIQRRLKSEDDSKFATFTTVQTDATGNYSTKVKVKKTYFYRAVVQENASCADESSNTQKVRVQKKKAAQEA